MDYTPARASARATWLLAAVAALWHLPPAHEASGQGPAHRTLAPEQSRGRDAAAGAVGGAGAAGGSDGEDGRAPSADLDAIGLPVRTIGEGGPGVARPIGTRDLTQPPAPSPTSPPIVLESVAAFARAADLPLDLTAEARAGVLEWPTDYDALQVELQLPPGDDSMALADGRSYAYALVAAGATDLNESAWVPLVGATLRITGLPYGDRELRVRTRAPGRPAVVDRVLSLRVARPWYRHTGLYGAVGLLLAIGFVAYRRSWQRQAEQLRASARPRVSDAASANSAPPTAAATGGALAVRDAEPPIDMPSRKQTDYPTPERPEVIIRPGLRPRRSPSSGPEVVDPSAPDPLESATLRELRSAVEAHYADPDFSTERLAVQLAVSKRTLSRMTVPLTGLTPAKLIAERRLERARELLAGGTDVQVKAVASQVGYRSADGFARAFRDRYGLSPSSYGAQRADRGE